MLIEPDIKKLNQILLVEDNPMVAKITISQLQGLGCSVSHAANGKSGIEMAKSKRYDLILMDVGLPDIDGVEVTKQIRLNENNNDVPVPIIALTAHVEVENKQKCMESGMYAVLSKPLSEDTMRDILNAFIPR